MAGFSRHSRRGAFLLLAGVLWLGGTRSTLADVHLATNDAELRAVLGKLKSGDTLQIAAGEYPGGNTLCGLTGLTVEAQDASKPPLFHGGTVAWHFVRCEKLTVKNLRINGQSHVGINVDEGGAENPPVSDVTFENLRVSNIGPKGNCDAIKASGVQDLVIRGCLLEGWGGQGIDLVGCHRVRITGCELKGKEGFSATAGVQAKGGSSEVIVERCHFIDAGQRALNLGGSTGMVFLRPAGVRYEAARLSACNNVIEGSDCAAAFVGVDGADFSGNTILFPKRWVFRILQETRVDGFAPSRNGVIKDNRIVFHRSEVRTEVNIGEGTAPESFVFTGNHWFTEDRPEASAPRLPVAESGGIYGIDPRNKTVPSEK